MQAYRELADAEVETDRYWEWVDANLPHLPEQVLEWVDSPAFEQLLVDTVRATYPQHEHEQFIAHFTGLLGLWVRDQRGLRG